MENQPQLSYSKRLVDEIVYMASLASVPQSVDPLLDRLRVITANVNFGKRVSAAEITSLESVKQDVEQYLLEKERVREFDQESLRKRVLDRVNGHNPLRALHAKLTVIFVVTVLFTAIPIVLPIVTHEGGLHMQFASSIFLTTMYLGAAWLFLAALKEFNVKVRQAYALICAGVVLLGLSQVLQPFIDLLGLRSWPYLTYLVLAFLLPTAVLMFAGVRRYALVVGVQSRLLSLRRVALVTAIMMALVIISPHGSSAMPELAFDIMMMIEVIILALNAAAAALIFNVKPRVTLMYAKAAAKLFHALVAMTLVTCYMILLILLMGEADGPAFAVAIVTFVVAGFLVLRAGYAFGKVSLH